MAKSRRDTKPPAREGAPPTREHVEETLDEALDESFPASDPPAITQPGGKGSLTDGTGEH